MQWSTREYLSGTREFDFKYNNRRSRGEAAERNRFAELQEVTGATPTGRFVAAVLISAGRRSHRRCLTIDGVAFVIDPGFAKRKVISPCLETPDKLVGVLLTAAEMEERAGVLLTFHL